MLQDYIKIIYEGYPAKLNIVAVHGLNPLNKTNYGERHSTYRFLPCIRGRHKSCLCVW
jgi:hypothetical protein